MIAPTEAPGQVRYADSFTANSTTGGIQEAVDDLPTAGGKVVCSGKTYSTSSPIWVHTGVHLNGAGIGATIIQRTTGSYVQGSANFSGACVICGPKGSNGTEFSSGTHGTDITITDMTLDGNQSNFSSLTNADLTPVGIRASYVDGLIVDRVKVKNTLMTAFYFANITDFTISHIHADTVGQWATTSDRNGISLHVASKGSVSNFAFQTIGTGSQGVGDAEAITIESLNSVSIGPGSVDYAGIGIEFYGTTATDGRNITISNIAFRQIKSNLVRVVNLSHNLYQTAISNLVCECHSTLHNEGLISIAQNGPSVYDINFDNIVATNINALDTTTHLWIEILPGTALLRNRLRFSNITMSGKSGSVRTLDGGIYIFNPADSLFFSNILIKDVAGIGIYINSSTAGTQANLHFDNVVVDGANGYGCQIYQNAVATTTKEVYFNNCVMKDCAKQAGANAGWLLQAAFAGCSIDHVYLRGCRSFKTSGTSHLYGLSLSQSAGTLDNIIVENCDFRGTQTAELISSGTVTNFRCEGYYVGDIQAITAVGNTITLPSLIKHCAIRLTSDGNYTLTSAPTLANGGFEGQCITIINEDTAETITIQDQGGLANSNLRLSAATIALAPRDNIQLIWNGTIADWVQVAQTNVV
jgi:hypothetical protein